MYVHFPSQDKDGSHTIRSTIVENPMLHANFMAVCFIDRALLPIKFHIAGIVIFDLFGSCDINLDALTFIYQLDQYSLEIYCMCQINMITSYVQDFKSCHLTDRQTDRHDQKYIPHCFVGGQQCNICHVECRAFASFGQSQLTWSMICFC